MFKVTVINSTDERKEPSIYAQKTGVRFGPGIIWTTDTRVAKVDGSMWYKTPNGFWTAGLYPINNDLLNMKTYLHVEIVEETSQGFYDKTDKMIHEVNGVVVAEYHRWLPS